MPAVIFSGDEVKALKDGLDLNDNAKLLAGDDDPTSVAKNAPRGSIYMRTGASGGAVYRKTDDGSSTNWTTDLSSSPISSAFQIGNFGISTSVGASALTINAKQSDGSTDATGGNPIQVGMRNSTVTNGSYNSRQITSSLSVVVSSGATLGHTDGDDCPIFVYVIDNSGTLELAVSRSSAFRDGELVSTTAMSAASDDADTLYSTTSRSNVPVRLIAELISNQTTAGTWSSNVSAIRLHPEASRFKSVVRLHTSNGHGSTNDKIRRYTTSVEDLGSDITYTDSATLGASFDINHDGVYSCSAYDNFDSAGATIGISLNSTQLTTSVIDITASDRLNCDSGGAADNLVGASWTGFLKSGDVIRPHTSGTGTNTAARAGFTITRVA